MLRFGLLTLRVPPPEMTSALPRLPRLPARSFARALGLATLILPLGFGPLGCASPTHRPVTQVGLSRETPKDAYEYLKAMIGANQVEAEWRSFSPGFKRRLSEQVGRNVDVGDYSQARATIASNSTKQIQMVLESEYVSDRALSENVALVTIRAGKRQATPRFVKMTTWELTLKGEGEPVAEFIPKAADVVSISPTGDVAMRVTPSSGTSAFLKDIPPDKIQRLVIQDEWYLDDFGGVEDAVVGGIRGEGNARGGATDRPSPREPAPQAPQAPQSGPTYLPPIPPPGGDPNAPPAPAGPGSPDAGPGSPDGGIGSPDGPPAR